MESITTKSRRLEQFFYLHGVDYESISKDDEGMTVWHYPATTENKHIVAEFKTALDRREKKGA